MRLATILLLLCVSMSISSCVRCYTCTYTYQDGGEDVTKKFDEFCGKKNKTKDFKDYCAAEAETLDSTCDCIEERNSLY